GKTVLSSTIIEHLKQDTSFGTLLYFYFDFNDTSKQTLDNVLCSLIKQLYQQRPDARQPLDQSWNAHGEGSQQPSTSSLQSVLQAMLSMIDRACIVLDALDESKSRRDLLVWLKTLATSKFTACQLLVTARREEDIESALQKWTHPEDRIAIQQSDVDADIEAYVTHQVHHGEDLRRWRSQEDMQKKIKLKLMKKANGMFRWAACQIEALRDCYEPRQLLEALEELPETLDDTYHRILERISKRHLQTALTVLGLLAWSEKPLRIGELIDAIAVQPSKSPGFCIKSRMPEPRDLLNICSSLVVLVQRPIDDNEKYHGEFHYGDPNTVESDGKEEVSELRLAHFSVKEYLVSHRVVQPFTGHLAEATARARIATICLTYLRDLDHNLSLKQMKARFQFAQYCARYWTDHARKSDERDEDLQSHILEFFEHKTTAYTTCYSLYDPDHPEKRIDQRRSDDVAEPLYYASLGGLIASVARLLDESADANAQGGRYGNALQAASAGGHDKIVQLLLDKGADVNDPGGQYGNALQAASAGGHDKTVQLLLDKGADVNDPGGQYGNALQAASAECHDKIVQLLLDKGADVNAQGGEYGNALYAASVGGHDKTVQLLLDKGADVNAKGGHYGNALYAASVGGHDK
ncbi:Pfs, NACHT and ankyrin domain protein, partial [Aureobasidium pullulans]